MKAWLGLLFVSVLACSTSPASDSDDGDTPKEPAEEPVTKPAAQASCGAGMARDEGKKTLLVGGHERDYLLVAPKPFDAARRYPIVFAFHGGGGNPESGRSSFDFAKLAPEAQAWFVYPRANSDGNWDLDSAPESNADVALFDALVAQFKSTRCVDSARIFATGESRGGYFSNQLGCRRANVLRGIAPHAGGGPYGDDDAYDADGNMRCSGAVATRIFHGEGDTTVAVSEGEQSLRSWENTNGCSTTEEPTAPTPCVALKGCSKPTSMCRIPGLGHDVWSQGVRATWSFFDSLK